MVKHIDSPIRIPEKAISALRAIPFSQLTVSYPLACARLTTCQINTLLEWQRRTNFSESDQQEILGYIGEAGPGGMGFTLPALEALYREEGATSAGAVLGKFMGSYAIELMFSADREAGTNITAHFLDIFLVLDPKKVSLMQYAHMLYDEVQALNLDLADSTNIHNPFTAEDGAMSDFHFFLGKCFGAAQVSGTEALDPLIDPDMVLRLAQSYEFIAASENNTAFGEGYLEGGEHVKDLFGVAHTSDEDKPDEWSLSDFWIPNKKPHAVNRN